MERVATSVRAAGFLAVLILVGCGGPGSSPSNDWNGVEGGRETEGTDLPSDLRLGEVTDVGGLGNDAGDEGLTEMAVADLPGELPGDLDLFADAAVDISLELADGGDVSEADLADMQSDLLHDAQPDLLPDLQTDSQPDVFQDIAPDVPPVLPECPDYKDPATTGFMLHFSVKEASGIVESHRNPGTLWVHNDSGDEARVYAVAKLGTSKGTFELKGADAVDWEDIAVGPGPDPNLTYIYVGDIGDNGGDRSSIQVYRVPEPEVEGGLIPPTITLSGVERFDLEYPDGAHNAESMMVDPWNGDVYVVVKSGKGQSPVFRAAAPLVSGPLLKLEQVAYLEFGEGLLAGDPETTAADINPEGTEVVIRTYDKAFLWRRLPGATVGEALTTEPCPLPLKEEGMGEALGFAADGKGYYTCGEGSMVAISYYAKK